MTFPVDSHGGISTVEVIGFLYLRILSRALLYLQGRFDVGDI